MRELRTGERNWKRRKNEERIMRENLRWYGGNEAKRKRKSRKKEGEL